MKNIVTPKTARKLKEAGFKQPNISPGQFWYKERYPGGTAAKWILCVFSELDFIPLDGGNFPTGEAVFAPTATDILRELGHKWFSAYLESNDVFYCTSSDEYYYYSDPNPAEAAALAWLKEHAK